MISLVKQGLLSRFQEFLCNFFFDYFFCCRHSCRRCGFACERWRYHCNQLGKVNSMVIITACSLKSTLPLLFPSPPLHFLRLSLLLLVSSPHYPLHFLRSHYIHRPVVSNSSVHYGNTSELWGQTWTPEVCSFIDHVLTVICSGNFY